MILVADEVSGLTAEDVAAMLTLAPGRITGATVIQLPRRESAAFRAGALDLERQYQRARRTTFQVCVICHDRQPVDQFLNGSDVCDDCRDHAE